MAKEADVSNWLTYSPGLRERLRFQPGAELDRTRSGELIRRVYGLSRESASLTKEIQQARTDNRTLRATAEGLQDDLTAARQSLRKMMRNT
ncbi:hypothetical protein [Streptomyces sp. NPDC059247]|uniref:hypothetical protein n=1 Tax=Streptomyces sp. NPDC059247 TaxID=3346790 RepID=UPI00368D9B6A